MVLLPAQTSNSGCTPTNRRTAVPLTQPPRSQVAPGASTNTWNLKRVWGSAMFRWPAESVVLIDYLGNDIFRLSRSTRVAKARLVYGKFSPRALGARPAKVGALSVLNWVMGFGLVYYQGTSGTRNRACNLLVFAWAITSGRILWLVVAVNGTEDINTCSLHNTSAGSAP